MGNKKNYTEMYFRWSFLTDFAKPKAIFLTETWKVWCHVATFRTSLQEILQNVLPTNFEYYLKSVWMILLWMILIIIIQIYFHLWGSRLYSKDQS